MPNTKGTRSKGKTTKQKPEMEVVFEKMDLNHDGRISVSELIQAYRKLGGNPTPAEAEQMIADCNPSQPGYVNKKEFCKLFKDHQADIDKEREEMIEAFKTFDKDNSGTITKDEIKSVLCACGEDIDDAELENMVRTADVDGDGNISIEEFASVMCEYGK